MDLFVKYPKDTYFRDRPHNALQNKIKLFAKKAIPVETLFFSGKPGYDTINEYPRIQPSHFKQDSPIYKMLKNENNKVKDFPLSEEDKFS